MTDLLILRGAPGVGKTSVGRLLTGHYANGVTIEIDEVRRMINAVTWTSVKEHLDAIEATRCLFMSYFNSGYKPIIIIDTLSQGTIQLIIDKIPKTLSYKVISLIADNDKIKKRIVTRNSGFLDYNISFKVNDSITKENLINNYLIDTTLITAVP